MVMCAAFAPPLKTGGRPTYTRRRRSRSHSPSTSIAHAHPQPTKMGYSHSICFSPADSPSSSFCPPTETPSSIAYVVPPPPVAAEGCSNSNDEGTPWQGRGRVALPSFTEIARGVITRDARSARNPFTRMRSRALEEDRKRQREIEKEHDVMREQLQRYQQLTRRTKSVVLVISLLMVTCGACCMVSPTITSKITELYQNASQRQDFFSRRSSHSTSPPPRTTLIGSLAEAMPTITSSREELWAVLEMVGVKAKLSQVDRAWSVLASGELRTEPGSGFSVAFGNATAAWSLSMRVFLAGALRNPVVFTAVCSIVALVLWGACGAWAAGGNVPARTLEGRGSYRDERVIIGSRSDSGGWQEEAMSEEGNRRCHSGPSSGGGGVVHCRDVQPSDSVLRNAPSSPRRMGDD